MTTEHDERIVSLTLAGLPSSSSFLHIEKKQAIHDILSLNSFSYIRDPSGPYTVVLGQEDGYLVFRITNATGTLFPALALSPRPYRRLIQDYFLMVESYEKARADGDPYRLESIDMGRRGIHNEGAELLIERLKDKIALDFETARRFFTLICALHIGGARVLVG